MFAYKTLSLALLIAGGLAVAVFIVGIKSIEGQSATARLAANQTIGEGSDAYTTSASASSVFAAPRQEAVTPNMPIATGAVPTNLTEELAQRIATTIVTSKMTDGNGTAPVDPSDLEALFADALDPTSIAAQDDQFIPEVSRRELTVASTNTAALVRAYGTAVNEIIGSDAEAVSDDELTADTIAAISERVRETAARLARLTVPPLAVTFHRRQLALARARENIIDTISRAADDPLGAVAAAAAWPAINSQFFNTPETFRKSNGQPLTP